MPIKGVSEWESDQISVDDFFLSKINYPSLYSGEEWRYHEYQVAIQNGKMPGKVILPPEEQLSPKGLALISHLYSERDKSEVQPLICDSIRGLHHVTALMDDAPLGTSVTVIFEPTNLDDASHIGAWHMLFSAAHKTVFKFDRTAAGVRVICVDGTNNDAYSSFPMIEMVKALQENAKRNNKPMTHLDVYKGITKPDDRQKSGFECGIFAIKDARQVNQDSRFDEGYLAAAEAQQVYLDNAASYKYIMPTSYLKSSQSRTAYKEILKENKDEVVTMKGKTLQQAYDKYEDSYANYFAKKYNKQVRAFIEGKSLAEIKEIVEKYDASKMTMERLIAIYGPLAREEAKKQSQARQQYPKKINVRTKQRQIKQLIANIEKYLKQFSEQDRSELSTHEREIVKTITNTLSAIIKLDQMSVRMLEKVNSNIPPLLEDFNQYSEHLMEAVQLSAICAEQLSRLRGKTPSAKWQQVAENIGLQDGGIRLNDILRVPTEQLHDFQLLLDSLANNSMPEQWKMLARQIRNEYVSLFIGSIERKLDHWFGKIDIDQHLYLEGYNELKKLISEIKVKNISQERAKILIFEKLADFEDDNQYKSNLALSLQSELKEMGIVVTAEPVAAESGTAIPDSAPPVSLMAGNLITNAAREVSSSDNDRRPESLAFSHHDHAGHLASSFHPPSADPKPDEEEQIDKPDTKKPSV